MKHLIFFLLTVYLSHSYGFLDFEVGHEYQFDFVFNQMHAVKDDDSADTQVKSNETISGVLTIKKPGDDWLFCEISNINSHPETLHDDLSKPFKLNGTNFSVSKFQDADGVSEEASKIKKKLMKVVLHDYVSYKRLIPMKSTKNVRVQLPLLDLCKIQYEKEVDGEEILASIEAESSNCEALGRGKGKPKVPLPDSTLSMFMRYNAADTSQKELQFVFEKRVPNDDDQLILSMYKCTLKLLESKEI